MKSVLLLLLLLILLLFLIYIVYTSYSRDSYEQKDEKYNLVAAAVFKNESHILKEWIDHYIYHGFDHIYLINDESTDNYKEIINPYIESGKVTLFENKLKINTYPKTKFVYNKYILPILSNSNGGQF